MSAIATEILIILLLLVANGLFAMTEIAIVSARKARLRRLSDMGDTKAGAALALAESPNRFLATVQIGITLVGVLAGAFGGVTIAEQIAARLQAVPAIAPYGEAVGIGAVVMGITFLSLIVGELVPKRIGLNNPERIARLMARPMNALATFASPLVRLLILSTDLVLKLIPLPKPHEPPVTEEDVKSMLQEGVRAGVFDRREPELVDGVLSLDRLPVRDIMTPRAKMTWLNLADPNEAIWHKIVLSGHSRYPVYAQTRDHLVGVVSLKSIYANLAAGIPTRLADLLVPPLLVTGTQTAAGLLEVFKRQRQHFAIVTDGSGHIVGLVTLKDVFEAIAGEFPSPATRPKPETREHPDGSTALETIESLKE